jgi:hypothetical protein
MTTPTDGYSGGTGSTATGSAGAGGAGATSMGAGSTGGASTSGSYGANDMSDVSVGQLLGAVTEDLSTLMRQELELAKAELRVEAKKAGQAAGMFGGAGFAGYFAVLFVSIALWQFMANVMDSGLAALIVAVLWGVLGAVLFVVGRSKAKQINPTPERTVETAKKVPDALKPASPSHAEETR